MLETIGRTLCVLGLLLGLVAWGVYGAPASAETGLDPVVEDVVEMLDSSVDEGVILQWLESTDRRPTDVGSQGVIALTQAGASEQLIGALLELVQEADEPVSESSRQEPETTLELNADDVEIESAKPPGPPGPSVEAVIELSAKQVWIDEDEPDSPREPPWWIYLYLDGELVAWTRPTVRGEPVEARRVLDSQRHELRVVLQRYEELRGGWHYESLSVPTVVGFESQPGDPIEITVEMKRIWGLWRQRKDGGPMSYAIRQGDEVLAEHAGTGGDPNRWQPICEDVEANFQDSEAVPKRFRNAMSRCVRWADLWVGAGEDTDRAKILAALAEYDFEPPVR